MLTFTDDPTTEAAEPENLKPSDLSPVEYFKGWAGKIDKEVEKTQEVRLHTIVTMCRRFRGATPSDLFGYVKYGNWLDHKSFDSLHGTNVFQALTRGAEANFTQSSVRLDITASNSNFEHRSTKKIAEGIYEQLLTSQWTGVLESQMFYAATLKLNYVLLSRFNRGIDLYKLRIPEFGKVGYEQAGLAVCNECDSPVPHSNLMETQCPECGSDDMTVIKDAEQAEAETVTGFKEYPAGSTETIVLDGFDFYADESGAEPGDLTPAQWFEYHYLVDKSELKKLYPHLKLSDRPKWTLATQWKMAIKRYENGPVNPTSEMDRRLYEVREIWISKSQAEEYISPIDFQLEQFNIKAGQRLSEVCPNGCVFGVINDEIAFVYDEDKNSHLTGGTWLSDPASYYGLGMKAGLPIQKKINQLDNINMDGIARAMRGAIVYDPEAINGQALEGSNINIPLRPDFSMSGKTFNEVYSVINVSGLSQDAMTYLESQRNIMQMIMGVPDAAIGEGDPNNQTLGGQQVLAARAVGLLIPAKKSQAHAMEEWFLQQCKLVQTYYDNDRIKEEFGSAYGEEWLDDEIEAFRTAELRKALKIRYTEGSEVPQSRAEKEQKLFALIGSGLIMPTPDILAKLADVAGLDEFDLGNYESNKRLGQKRWQLMEENMEQVPDAEEQYQAMELQMLDPRTGMRPVDPMGNKIPNPILMAIMNLPEMQVNDKAEDHNIQIEFWADKLRGLLAQTQLSQLKIDLCDAFINRHEMALMGNQTKANLMAARSAAPAQVETKLLDNATNPPEEKPNAGKAK